MGIFSGLFRSRDKPKDSCDSPSYSYFFGRTHAGKRGPHGNADHHSLCLREPEKTGTASTAYSDAFWNSTRNRNWIDVRNDLHVGTDTEGGYLVPDEFERKLIEELEEENIFRRMATVIKTSSGDRKIPIVTSKGDAVWMDEEEQYTLSDDIFGQAFSIYEVLPQLTELWGLNVETQAESKKTSQN